MTVPGIEAIGFTPMIPVQLGTDVRTTGVAAPGVEASGQAFGTMVTDNLDRLEGLQDRSDTLAVQAATGDLANIHDYTIAATEAQVTTQVTMAVRNKAVDAFNEIMRMQV